MEFIERVWDVVVSPSVGVAVIAKEGALMKLKVTPHMLKDGIPSAPCVFPNIRFLRGERMAFAVFVPVSSRQAIMLVLIDGDQAILRFDVQVGTPNTAVFEKLKEKQVWILTGFGLKFIFRGSSRGRYPSIVIVDYQTLEKFCRRETISVLTDFCGYPVWDSLKNPSDKPTSHMHFYEEGLRKLALDGQSLNAMERLHEMSNALHISPHEMPSMCISHIVSTTFLRLDKNPFGAYVKFASGGFRNKEAPIGGTHNVPFPDVNTMIDLTEKDERLCELDISHCYRTIMEVLDIAIYGIRIGRVLEEFDKIQDPALSKLLKNSVYGQLGNTKSLMYSPEDANAIIATAKKIMIRVHDCLKDDCRILWENTDGLQIVAKNPAALALKMQSAINDEFDPLLRRFSVAVKNTSVRMLILKHNSYIALGEDGSIVRKGAHKDGKFTTGKMHESTFEQILKEFITSFNLKTLENYFATTPSSVGSNRSLRRVMYKDTYRRYFVGDDDEEVEILSENGVWVYMAMTNPIYDKVISEKVQRSKVEMESLIGMLMGALPESRFL